MDRSDAGNFKLVPLSATDHPQGRVARVAIDTEKKRNAISAAVADQLARVFESLANGPGNRTGVSLPSCRTSVQ